MIQECSASTKCRAAARFGDLRAMKIQEDLGQDAGVDLMGGDGAMAGQTCLSR